MAKKKIYMYSRAHAERMHSHHLTTAYNYKPIIQDDEELRRTASGDHSLSLSTEALTTQSTTASPTPSVAASSVAEPSVAELSLAVPSAAVPFVAVPFVAARALNKNPGATRLGENFVVCRLRMLSVVFISSFVYILFYFIFCRFCFLFLSGVLLFLFVVLMVSFFLFSFVAVFVCVVAGVDCGCLIVFRSKGMKKVWKSDEASFRLKLVLHTFLPNAYSSLNTESEGNFK